MKNSSKKSSKIRLYVFSTYLFLKQQNEVQKYLLKLSRKDVKVTYIVFLPVWIIRMVLTSIAKDNFQLIKENNRFINNNLRLITFWNLVPMSRFIVVNKFNYAIKKSLIKLMTVSQKNEMFITWFLCQKYYKMTNYLKEFCSVFDTLDVRSLRKSSWEERLLMNNNLFFFVYNNKDNKQCCWKRYDNTSIKERLIIFNRTFFKICKI